MRRMTQVVFIATAPVLALLLGTAGAPAAGAPPPDAAAIVKRAIDYWRGRSSYTLMAMTVHRPDSERQSVTRAWTPRHQGRPRALHRAGPRRRECDA